MPKKIIYGLLLLLSLNKVYAEDLWVDYLEDGITNYEKQVRFKWYEEEIEGDYFEYGQVPDKYHYKADIPIYSQYLPWSENCQDGYDLENKLTNGYQELKQIKYVKIYNFSSSSGTSMFGLLYNGTSTSAFYNDYQMACDKMSCVDENSYVIMELYHYHYIDEISVRLFLTNPTTTYTIEMSDDVSFKNIIAKYETNGSKKYSDAQNATFNDYSWQNIVYTDETPKETYYRKVYKNIEICRYRKKYYYWFNYKRVYFSNDYLTKAPGYIKDEDNYKVYYKYDMSKQNNSCINHYPNLEKEKVNYQNIYINNLLPLEKEKIENRQNIIKTTCQCKENVTKKYYSYIYYLIITLIVMTFIKKFCRISPKKKEYMIYWNRK